MTGTPENPNATSAAGPVEQEPLSGQWRTVRLAGAPPERSDYRPRMPQNVPPFEWTDDALRLRAFMFDFWFEHRRPPMLRDCHEGLGLDRRAIQQAYKLLDLGLNVTVDQRTQNLHLLKAPPFSAYPTQVAMYDDRGFHSYIGCPHEALGASNSPQVRGQTLRFEMFCACCLEPIAVVLRDYEILERSHPEPLIHVTESPWDWNSVDMISMCDATNIVIDAEHGERYERMQSRRAVTMTLEQAREYIRFVAETRLWNYHWEPLSMDPAFIFERLQSFGIDVSPWVP